MYLYGIFVNDNEYLPLNGGLDVSQKSFASFSESLNLNIKLITVFYLIW